MKIVFFDSPAAWREWLERNHSTRTELCVGFYKRATGRPSLTWPESVDEALCFGWIDGVRRRIDDERYQIRFTPRKARSNWSAVNLKRVAALSKSGRMHEAGLEAHAARGKKRDYSYEERRKSKLSAAQEKQFKANRDAWQWFQSQPPWYRQAAIFWVASAKQAPTRERRLTILIECSSASQPVPPLRRRD